MGRISARRNKASQQASAPEELEAVDAPARASACGKERNLCTFLSIALHACLISLLMVPSPVFREKPLQAVLVDFTQREDRRETASGANVSQKKGGQKPGIPKGGNSPGRIGASAPLEKGPSGVQGEMEQVAQPLAPAAVAVSEAQGETAEHSEEPTPVVSDPSAVALHGDRIHAAGGSDEDPRAAVGASPDSGGLTWAGRGFGQENRQGGNPFPSSGSAGDAGASSGGPQGGVREEIHGEEGWGEGGENYAYLRDAIMKNVAYPDKARRLGLEGRVLLSFVVLENGTMCDIKVIQSSAYRSLDESAKEAVARSRVVKKLPYRVIVRLPITYRLQGSGRDDRL